MKHHLEEKEKETKKEREKEEAQHSHSPANTIVLQITSKVPKLCVSRHADTSRQVYKVGARYPLRQVFVGQVCAASQVICVWREAGWSGGQSGIYGEIKQAILSEETT